MLIGVVLPVSTPSTLTLAPDGKEVTFSEPVCASRVPALRQIAISSYTNIDNRRIFQSSVFVQGNAEPAAGTAMNLIGKSRYSFGIRVDYPETGAIKCHCNRKESDIK